MTKCDNCGKKLDTCIIWDYGSRTFVFCSGECKAMYIKNKLGVKT